MALETLERPIGSRPIPMLDTSTSVPPPYCLNSPTSSMAVRTSSSRPLSRFGLNRCRILPSVSWETGFSKKARSLALGDGVDDPGAVEQDVLVGKRPAKLPGIHQPKHRLHLPGQVIAGHDCPNTLC